MDVAIVRAAYLNVYIAELRAIGAPVERELARSQLPSWIEESPDAYISSPLMLAWVARCGRDFQLMDLAYRGAQRASLATLNKPLQRALQYAPVGSERLRTFLQLAKREDNRLETGIHPEGDEVRVICETMGFERNPFVCLAEWINVQEVISLVRSIVGPGWSPREMTFISRHLPSAASQEAFSDTRILVGQPHTSITIESEVLARPCPAEPLSPARPGDDDLDEDSGNWSFATALRLTVRPYLAEGHPDLARIVDIIGVSRRTLQRLLQRSGRTYSDVVQEARFDLARELLSEPSARIIDVATAVGYENPQHFSRAFRRIAGVSPLAYRRAAIATA